MLLYICRHGQTDHNVQGIIQGHLDTELNEHGRFEASRLSASLSKIKFDEAYSSPLSRAHETAKIVLSKHPELTLRTDDRIKERGLGSMEGRRRKRGEKAPGDAESHADLAKRIYAWLVDLLDSHAVSHDKIQEARENTDTPKILIVSHGAWIASLINVLLSRPIQCQIKDGVDVNGHLLNTCVTKVRLWQSTTGKGWRGEIVSFADLSHLNDINEPDLEVADDVED